jgi:hypothetical protein
MELIRSELILEFDQSTQLITPARKVFDILAQAPPQAKFGEPGVRIRDSRTKKLVRWRYERLDIILEQIDSKVGYLSEFMKSIEMVNSAAPIGKIARILLTTNWILPMPAYDFDQLNQRYVEKMVSPKMSIPDSHIYDSSVILDGNIGDNFKIHHQSGPMEPKQLLKEYLEFHRKNIPDVFLFLLVGTYYVKMVEYSNEELQRILIELIRISEQHSVDINKIWEDKP